MVIEKKRQSYVGRGVSLKSLSSYEAGPLYVLDHFSFCPIDFLRSGRAETSVSALNWGRRGDFEGNYMRPCIEIGIFDPSNEFIRKECFTKLFPI